MKMCRKAAAAVVVGIGVALALSGCGRGARADSIPQVHAFDSAAISASSLEDVAADSTAVVLAKWTGRSTNAYVGNTPYPVSTMQVIKVLRGAIPTGTVDVRVGYEDANTGRSPLDTDATYLLFLKPFWLEPGKDTGQYTTAAGPFGVFAGSPDTSTTFTTVVIPDDGMSGSRPASLTDITLQDAAQLPVSTADALATRDRAGVRP